MGEISMSGSTRERAAAVIGLWAFHSVLSSLLYWLLSLCHDLVGDGLHQCLGFRVRGRPRALRFCSLVWNRARHAWPPLVIVTQFTFLEAEPRVGNAEALFDLQQVLQLCWRHGIDRLAQLRSDDHCPAIGLQDFHLEIGVLDMVMAPGHHAVVSH